MILTGKEHDLGGGFLVRRLIPQVQRRMVGPFVFFDHMGPILEKAGQNTDVRPHPHIGLSTLTYLFEGRVIHRDSVGSISEINPGDVNWMTAGSGISHSERSHPEDKNKDRTAHGLQFWVALPDGLEEIEPSFQHYNQSLIPKKNVDGIEITLIAGSGFGLESPVKTTSSLILASIKTHKDSILNLNFSDFDLAVYVIKGEIQAGSEQILPYQALILEKPRDFKLKITQSTKFIVFGGLPFVTKRHVWWNLVSSSKEKIEEAKTKWLNGTFPMVPGETEFIPLPKS